MNGRVPTQDVEGVVEATNAKGLKIGGAWVNVSQFNPVELPETGAHVRLQVDSKGYIKTLEVLHNPATASVSQPSKDERITRLAVGKIAGVVLAAALQSRESARVEHFDQIADRILAWVENHDAG